MQLPSPRPTRSTISTTPRRASSHLLRCAVGMLFSLVAARPAWAESDEQRAAGACLSLSSVGEKILEVRRLQIGLYYEAAQVCVNSILADPRADDSQLAQAHMQAGMIAAVTNDTELSRSHFLSVLRHNPHASLPPGTSPKINKNFEAIRKRYLASHPQAAADPDPIEDDAPPPPPASAGTKTDSPQGPQVEATVHPADDDHTPSLPTPADPPATRGHLVLYAGVGLAAAGATAAAVGGGIYLNDPSSNLTPILFAGMAGSGALAALGVIMMVLDW